MAAGETPATTSVDLDETEVALIIGEEDGSLVVRVVAGNDKLAEMAEMPAAPEIVMALAKRLLEDPDFHDDVLDWYYEHLDEDEEDEDEEEEG